MLTLSYQTKLNWNYLVICRWTFLFPSEVLCVRSKQASGGVYSLSFLPADSQGHLARPLTVASQYSLPACQLYCAMYVAHLSSLYLQSIVSHIVSCMIHSLHDVKIICFCMFHPVNQFHFSETCYHVFYTFLVHPNPCFSVSSDLTLSCVLKCSYTV